MEVAFSLTHRVLTEAGVIYFSLFNNIYLALPLTILIVNCTNVINVSHKDYFAGDEDCEKKKI